MRKPVLVLAIGSSLLASASSVQATHNDEIQQVALSCPRFVVVDQSQLPENTSARPILKGTRVTIDATIIDKRGTTTGLDVEYRLFAPGATHWGQASFTSAVTLGASKELRAWFDAHASSKSPRRVIVNLPESPEIVPAPKLPEIPIPSPSQRPSRSYVFHDCSPLSRSGVSEKGAADADAIEVQAKGFEFLP